jgi:hypothetical protein
MVWAASCGERTSRKHHSRAMLRHETPEDEKATPSACIARSFCVYRKILLRVSQDVVAICLLTTSYGRGVIVTSLSSASSVFCERIVLTEKRCGEPPAEGV